MESATQDYAPAKPTKRSFGKKHIIVLVVILVLLTGGIVFMSNRGSSGGTGSITPTTAPPPTDAPTPEITETASPSAAPSGAITPSAKPTPAKPAEVKKATDMNIQILNGSGEVGVASTARDLLKSHGYQYFETGNADNYDYKDVTVKVKSKFETYGATLKKDLEGKYKLASDSATLPGDSVFDAVVIVGK
jgi:hypothetical protein